jgi:dethiobiotin synthetase
MGTLFITATGTDVGKTYITCALIETFRRRGRPVDAFKPALTGYHGVEGSDAGAILKALGEGPERLDHVAPLRFAASLAPPSAARAEGRTVDLGEMNRLCRIRMAEAEGKALLIEGVGGVMSPIADGATNLDLICDLEVPTLLVVGSYLGSVTHTLTAIEALRGRYVPIWGAVVSQSEGENPAPSELSSAMAQFAPGIPVVVAPRGESWDASELADLLDRNLI